MWIRSQDKRTLVDVECIYSGNGLIHEKFEIMGAPSSGTISLLGKYKSEERALEVLYMIQSRIIKGATFDYINNSKRITKEFVFQMPEE